MHALANLSCQAEEKVTIIFFLKQPFLDILNVEIKSTMIMNIVDK